MKKTILFIIMVVVALTSSFAQEKRYAFENAVLKKISGARGVTSSTVYIDDYGRNELTESIMSIPNQENVTSIMVTLIKDGYAYYTEKRSNDTETTQYRGTKIDIATVDDYTMINYLNLTDEVKKKFQIEEKGNEQLLGKDCNVYELIQPALTTRGISAKITVWVWQGLPLKSAMTAMLPNGEEITSVVEEVTEIQENVTIAKEKFVMPENVIFLER